MSDETTRTDASGSEGAFSGEFHGETTGQPQAQAWEQPQSAGGRSGFCQDCGRPLSPTTARAVGTAVFCDPCLTARVGATPPNQAYATPPYTTVPPPAAVADEPRPVLAALLGFIPGVGAMYNGQFAKGIVHLAIFAILVSLSDDVNDIFGLFVAGWEFYMVFEAYHTAVARRDGLPLPNAFGFNDIGERMGFGRGWAAGAPRSPASNVPPAPGAGPSTGTEYVPKSTYPPSGAPAAAAPAASNPAASNPAPASSDWIGYVPPTAFASSTAAPPVSPIPPAAPSPPYGGWSHTPYADTYTGAPRSYDPLPAGRPDLAAHRFPASALWLIGLGVLVLLANLLPDWKLTERWWPPILFACLAVWVYTRRMRSGARVVCILRWPVLLMVLAVMLALHAAYFVITTTLTVAVLLIAYGALLLLERTAAPGPMHIDPPPGPYQTPASAGDPRDEEARSRAAWAAANDAGVKGDTDSNEGRSDR